MNLIYYIHNKNMWLEPVILQLIYNKILAEYLDVPDFSGDMLNSDEYGICIV